MELLKMQSLPLEILFEQAVQLDLPTLTSLCQTNHYLYEVLCNNNNFWKVKFKHDFGEVAPAAVTNWKTYYLAYNNLWMLDDFGTLIEYKIKPLQISVGVDKVALIDMHNQVWTLQNRQLKPMHMQANYVAVGKNHSIIIDLNNQVWEDGTALNLKALQIALGLDDHILAIRAPDKQVLAWGKNQWGQANPNSTEVVIKEPQALNLTAIKVAAGTFFSVCIDTQAQLWFWGYNSLLGLRNLPQQVSPTIIATNVKDVTVGSAHILIIDLQNNVWAVGNNRQGQLGTGDFINREVFTALNIKAQQISAAAAKSMLIDLENNIHLWGYYKSTINSNLKATQIVAGVYKSALVAKVETL